MLKIENVSLARTSRSHENLSVKSLVIEALSAPFSYFTQKKITESFLQNINIEIKPSERVAFIGRNGSGKTTLCRLISGQLFPTSGHVITNSRVSLFSQLEESFFMELTGRENLEFFFDFIYPSLTGDYRQQVFEECISFTGLEKKIDRAVETYSLGMISRLALSLITAHPHELLILDEVHNHADKEFRNKFAERLKKTIENSKSFIVVSHYHENLISSCDRGIVFDSGKILFDGSIEKAIAFYNILPLEAYV